jgi:hypothetical protein
MKIRFEYILVAVLVSGTAIFTKYFYIPETRVNKDVEIILNTPSIEKVEAEETSRDKIGRHLDLEKGKTSTYNFSILNRELPYIWEDKEMYLKYTYLGEYDEDTITVMNEMLDNEYDWRNQLDHEGNVVFNGPLLSRDNTYQLYVHNTLYHAQRYYLLGDVLDMLWDNNEIVGTQIDISGLKMEAMWSEDIRVLQDSNLKNSADLIISTCLERNGDWRLVVGFNFVEEI